MFDKVYILLYKDERGNKSGVIVWFTVISLQAFRTGHYLFIHQQF